MDASNDKLFNASINKLQNGGKNYWDKMTLES